MSRRGRRPVARVALARTDFPGARWAHVRILLSCKRSVLRVISLTVNGEPRRFDAPLTAAQLIACLELTGKRVALERNGEIVPRSNLEQQELSDGDRVEIVVAVGGG